MSLSPDDPESGSNFEKLVQATMLELEGLQRLAKSVLESGSHAGQETASNLRRTATSLAAACALALGMTLPAGISDSMIASSSADTDATAESVSARRALPRVTPRQREVLALVVQGMASNVIAARLNIAVKTVERHRSDAKAALGARTAVLAAIEAQRLGLI